MALEVRPFTNRHGSEYVLVKRDYFDGHVVCLTLNKVEYGNVKKVAEKIYNYSSKCADIRREAYDSNGNSIRSSLIPIYSGDSVPSGFWISDGETILEGRLANEGKRINKSKIFDIDKMEVNLKTTGNLAKRYINKIIEHFAKLR
jgi:hypothetical protein